MSNKKEPMTLFGWLTLAGQLVLVLVWLYLLVDLVGSCVSLLGEP